VLILLYSGVQWRWRYRHRGRCLGQQCTSISQCQWWLLSCRPMCSVIAAHWWSLNGKLHSANSSGQAVFTVAWLAVM